MNKLRKTVFFPTFILLVVAVVLSLTQTDTFLKIVNSLNTGVKSNFGWLFSFVSVGMVILCVWIYFSPIGKQIIGGEGSKPLLNTWEWFAVTLCTTIAAGMIFWAASEPIFHLTAPPVFLGIAPDSSEAAIFSMSTMFVHWTITPYAIYCVPGLMFAIAYYNMKKPFSFQGCVSPLLGDKTTNRILPIIDSISLYTVALGMAASLGTGILSISGGISHISGISSTPMLWTVVAVLVITVFIISSISGLMKGIKLLSTFNVRLFIGIAIFMFIMGPTSFLLNILTESYGVYIDNFFTRNLVTGTLDPNNWTHFWTISYFANWMAWAPVTALFLGRISYGHSVRKFILINLLIPAGFSTVWIGIFGGSAIYNHLNVVNLYDLIKTEGVEKVLYKVIEYLPLSQLLIPVIVIATFISFVTAADSTTNAMSGLSWKGTSLENPEPPILLKFVWGILIGAVALLMINTSGVRGLKMLSAFGGFPALLLLTVSAISLLKVSFQPKLIKVNVENEQGEMK